jgi:AcrR family transcriptional regulator
MPRKRPENRLDQLVEAAGQVFMALGYRRTQMADVARAMGVAPGTLYLYVESKEALFDLVVRRASDDLPDPSPALPIPTPRPGATLEHLERRIASSRRVTALDEALGKGGPVDARKELEAIVRDLYAVLSRNHRGITLMDRSALDYPELAAVWFQESRGDLLARLERYLEDRIRRKLLRPVPDVAVAARFILESLVLFAVHRHRDPAPQPMDEKAVEDTLVHFIVHSLAR